MSTYGSHVCGGGGIVYKIANLLYNVLIITNSLYRYKKNYSYREVNPLVPRCSL